MNNKTTAQQKKVKQIPSDDMYSPYPVSLSHRLSIQKTCRVIPVKSTESQLYFFSRFQTTGSLSPDDRTHPRHSSDLLAVESLQGVILHPLSTYSLPPSFLPGVKHVPAEESLNIPWSSRIFIYIPYTTIQDTRHKTQEHKSTREQENKLLCEIRTPR